ncbi:MAG: hypothetical protein K9J48_02035 [Desulfohalobiaceae bacterium]|nr:hypothetical protein [Desulfohalobiaceae bacterium]MCF8085650.1 hypothetical protein [Desulfohalobiaceae bacterium]
MPQETPPQATSSAFPVRSPPRFRPLVLEFQEEWVFLSRDSASLLTDLQDLASSVVWIVDYQESSGPGTIEVQTSPKYAPMLARRHLEEQGVYSSEAGRLWIYAKQALEKNRTRVLYHIFPAHPHTALEQRYLATETGFQAFDTVGLLWSLLLGQKGKKPRAMVLHLPDSLLLLAGTRNQLDLARRYSHRFGSGLDEAASLMEQDLSYLEQEQARKVEDIDWILAWSEEEITRLPEMERGVAPWPVCSYTLDESRSIWTGLPFTLGRLSGKYSIAGREESWLRPLESAEPALWGGLTLVALVAGAMSLQLMGANRDLGRRIQDLQGRIGSYERVLETALEKKQAPAYQGPLELARQIGKAHSAPSYAAIWNELARLAPQSLTLTDLLLEYGENKLTLSLEGEIGLGLAQAQEVFGGFVGRLGERGFSVRQRSLNLALDTSHFSLDLELPYRGAAGETEE